MPIDGSGRSVRYLRISLTDACNLSCRYCMPDQIAFRPARELMTNEEVLRLIQQFAAVGFEKIRFTGGEPTLRDNLLGLIQSTRELDGIREVVLTTNGLLLKELARPLVHAGLQRVNINLNTLQPRVYRRITRGGRFKEAWEGLLAADREGLQIKINSVILRGYNDGKDPAELARLTLTRPWDVRFIEAMPLGSVASFQQSSRVSESKVRRMVVQALGPLTPVRDSRSGGQVRLYRLQGASGRVGFISSVAHPFCDKCTRARLTADGKMRLCLLQEDEIDLLTPLREGATDKALRELIRKGLKRKPAGHDLAHRKTPRNRVMSEIGG
ncbi:MAG TPA: GTP 3',8-cyclase MoaA [Verrucomicrobia bacterium]|nr:MAG: cyclic pyranopterin phosphate synthase MoaA [Lentisphaerae bacterium GWF2_57_35]HBA84600.1 GTP 3',8-cyclase MoaA [Verrucomicrobiota bacterium]